MTLQKRDITRLEKQGVKLCWDNLKGKDREKEQARLKEIGKLGGTPKGKPRKIKKEEDKENGKQKRT